MHIKLLKPNRSVGKTGITQGRQALCMVMTNCTAKGAASGWLLRSKTDLQLCSRLCSRLSAGALGTSPNTWMVMSCMLIAKVRSRGGTDHNTIAF